MNNIDPYELFGFNNNNISLKGLKKKYYEYSLLCHPDKGGSKEDFIIIHNSYLYIKQKLQYKNKYILKNSFINKDIKFSEYMKKYKKEPPPFYNIWLESEDYEKHKLFNKKFEEIHSKSLNKFNNGYGHLMDITNNNENYHLDTIYINILKNTIFPKNVKELILSYLITNKNIFYNNNKLIIYKSKNDYGLYERLDDIEVNDFSTNIKNLQLNDYKLAHSINNNIIFYDKRQDRTYEDLLKERKLL